MRAHFWDDSGGHEIIGPWPAIPEGTLSAFSTEPSNFLTTFLLAIRSSQSLFHHPRQTWPATILVYEVLHILTEGHGPSQSHRVVAFARRLEGMDAVTGKDRHVGQGQDRPWCWEDENSVDSLGVPGQRRRQSKVLRIIVQRFPPSWHFLPEATMTIIWRHNPINSYHWYASIDPEDNIGPPKFAHHRHAEEKLGKSSRAVISG